MTPAAARRFILAGTGLAAAIAVGYGVYAELASDAPYDEARALAEHARRPPQRFPLPAGLVLPRVEAEAGVDPLLVDVTMDPKGVSVHGRRVWRPGQPMQAIRGAVEWATRFPALLDADVHHVNFAVDARVAFLDFARALREVGQAGFWRIALVVARGDGALAAVPLGGSFHGVAPVRVVIRPEQAAYRVESNAPLPDECAPPPGSPQALRRCAQALIDHAPQMIDSEAIAFTVEGTSETSVTSVLDTLERIREVAGMVTLAAPEL